jgi:methylenetetrahydrofolate reductase (NADPH)
MLDMANGEIPISLMAQFDQYRDDPDSIRELGIEVATRVSEEVLDAGAEGLHFYTLNSAKSTLEVVKRLGVRDY